MKSIHSKVNYIHGSQNDVCTPCISAAETSKQIMSYCHNKQDFSMKYFSPHIKEYNVMADSNSYKTKLIVYQHHILLVS